MPEIKVDVPDASGKSYESATREAMVLAEGQDLEGEAKRNQHRRSENLKDHMGRGAVLAFWIFFWVVVAIATAGGIIWGWHMLTPASLHFLTDNQVRDIESHVFTTLVGGMFGFFAKQKFFG